MYKWYIKKMLEKEQDKKLEKVGKVSTESVPFWYRVKDKGREEKEKKVQWKHDI